jgi:hypothetical protein
VPDRGAAKSGGLNAGQSLVAEYRAARLRQRPSLQTELRNDRLSLREQRAATLARRPPTRDAGVTTDTKQPDAAAATPAMDSNCPGAPSMFAQFVDHAHGQNVAAEAAAQPLPAASPALPVTETAIMGDGPAVTLSVPDEPVPVVEAGLAAATSVAPSPALAAIGFGPGMIIRFRQLGIKTASDLAAADEAGLRAALGDISRLVNVDVWIDSARRACAEAG